MAQRVIPRGPNGGLMSDDHLLIAMGVYNGVSHINKFGRSTDVDNGVATDVWDRANFTDGQDTWVAPTTAVIHNIKSSDANDAAAGTGARTVQVCGLVDFDTKEVSEIITLNGITDVPTVNSYVLIHRMEVLTKGATSVNVGTITATGVGGGNPITAQINAGEGQTLMAIYGIPSNQTGWMTNFYASVQKVSSGRDVLVRLVSNREPQNELLNFTTKHIFTITGGGASDVEHFFGPYKEFEGPCIIKMEATGDANDMDVSAGFDIILVDNDQKNL